MPYITKETLSKTCDEIKELLTRKNQAYGNSFETVLIQEGLNNALVRMNDKFSRLRTLSSSGLIADNGESIMDTIQDIIGYGVLIQSYINSYEKELIEQYIKDYDDAKFIPVCDVCGHQLNELACPKHGMRSLNRTARNYAKKVIMAELRGQLKPDYDIVKKIDTESNSNFIYKSHKDSVLIPPDDDSYVTITSVDEKGHVLVDCVHVTHDSEIKAIWNVDEKKLIISDKEETLCSVPLCSIRYPRNVNNTIEQIENDIQQGRNIDLRKYI